MILNHLPFEMFVMTFNSWVDKLFHQSLRTNNPVSKHQIINEIANMCIEQLNAHFEIVIITVETEIRKKVIHQYII
jgi:hypothetical protein